MPSPTRAHLVKVAKQIKKELGSQPFITWGRLDITDLVREASGEDNTRLKAAMAADLEQALLEEGIRCFPLISATTSGDQIRFFHTGTTFGALVSLLQHPDHAEDATMLAVLGKVRTVWRGVPVAP